ncbi:glycoside hydrolase family 26 protein [Patescibacteria group bacterium]
MTKKLKGLIILLAVTIPILAIASYYIVQNYGDTEEVEASIPQEMKVLPPENGIYHSAFPFFGNTEDKVTAKKITNFERLANKEIAWAFFSNHWNDELIFPEANVQTIHNARKIPFIRLQPWNANKWWDGDHTNYYSMQKIINGNFDDQLIAWADAAKTTEIPLMVEFGCEVNGDWFPWCGKHNGGGTKTNYGDPTYPDGPERYRDAYRHVIDLFETRNVNNITWAFHVNNWRYPWTNWNKAAKYYPGDNYIDWIGMSVYGAQYEDDEWEDPINAMEEPYEELCTLSPDKPIAIFEMGVDENPNYNKAAWIRKAFNSIKDNDYPRLKAVSWWHEKWNEDGDIIDLRINSSASAKRQYRKGVGTSLFVTEPVYSGMNALKSVK